MYGTSSVLALIPARAGSKGIKNKNIADLCGKPLIAYSIEAAKHSRYIDDVVVSTDGEAIAGMARLYGADVPFLRPTELASDTSKTIDAVLHAVKFLNEHGRHFDILVLLQPTQPLRTSEDIDMAMEIFFENGEESLVSVTDVDSHPLLIRSVTKDGKLRPLMSQGSTCRRQDMPRYYCVNGAVYINRISELSKDTSFNDNKIPFFMERSHSVDIDEPLDLTYAKFLQEQENETRGDAGNGQT
ncbi:MAG: acylneuraminate cytidylyltransferase family protein [Lachnospiraceae bacterium]|nr:acylneuraminate cytidylyltransferase family protein [Lachnospiraceae bacterium]